jgi:hypothetical protein
MRITDIIRGVLDLADMAGAASAPVQVTPQEPVIVSMSDVDAEPDAAEPDMIAVLKQLAGMEADCGVESVPEYANEPNEMTAPVAAAFPGGDDVHARKNPADIRTNAPSMYPGYQAGAR